MFLFGTICSLIEFVTMANVIYTLWRRHFETCSLFNWVTQSQSVSVSGSFSLCLCLYSTSSHVFILIKFNLIYLYTKWFCPVYINHINYSPLSNATAPQSKIIDISPTQLWTEHTCCCFCAITRLWLSGNSFGIFKLKLARNRCAKFSNDFWISNSNVRVMETTTKRKTKNKTKITRHKIVHYKHVKMICAKWCKSFPLPHKKWTKN